MTAGETSCVWRNEIGPDDGGLIVAVHGAMDRSGSFVRFARELADRYRVLRYDRRGYARSRHCPGPIVMATHVADLVALIDGRPAVVLGHSYGGNVALAASITAPNILGVVAYENPLSWLPWWTGMSRRPIDPNVPAARVAESFMRRVVGEAVWEALPEAVKQQRREEGETLVAELRDLANEPWRPEQLTVPIVAMFGADTVERHQRASRLVAEIAGGAPVVVEGAGHHGPASHPAAVAATVAALAERVGLPAGTARTAGAVSPATSS